MNSDLRPSASICGFLSENPHQELQMRFAHEKAEANGRVRAEVARLLEVDAQWFSPEPMQADT